MIKDIAKRTLYPVLKPFRPANICMLHIGRCGSTVLSSMLSQHKQMYWASEFYATIFHKWEKGSKGEELPGDMPDDAVSLLKGDMRKALHRYYGFEIKPFHFQLIGYSQESFFHILENLKYTHFIHLDRRNRLRKIVSSLIAHENNMIFHQKGKTAAKLKQVSIDVNSISIDYQCKSLYSFLSDYDQQVLAVKEMLEEKNSLSLSYEDDIQEDPRIGYQKICDFIGLKSKEVSVKLSRTNPFPVKDMIKNFNEVEAVLKGTVYEWMLYE